MVLRMAVLENVLHLDYQTFFILNSLQIGLILLQNLLIIYSTV